MGPSLRQSVEMFHLVFLQALLARGADRALFALKGGCNLRFFFGSIRYSEDIDLDAATMARDTLRNKVDRLLLAPIVVAPLKARGITLAETSAPKQTETTQRWKIGLAVAGLAVPVRTKIEFSRRDRIVGSEFAALDRDLLRSHGLPPFLATHYPRGRAIAQKIHALCDRVQPQARDVFDLNLLFAAPESAGLQLADDEKCWLPDAIEHAAALSHDEYLAQVVAFLDPAQATLYEGREVWHAMQDAVVARLEALR
jgi:hypothetical protein